MDKRADIYSLGVVLYEMLTGEHPFKGDSVEDFFASQLNDPFRDPRQIVPDIPIELVDILRKCITVLPDDRYNSIKELKTDLERLQRQAPSEPHAIIADDPLRGALLNDLSAEPENNPALAFAPQIGTDGNLKNRSPKTITVDAEADDHFTPTPIAIPNMATPVLGDMPAPIVVQPVGPTSRRQSLRLAALAMVAATFILLTGNHFWVDAVSGKQPDLPFSTVHLTTENGSAAHNWAIPVLDDILASSPNTSSVHTTIVTAAPATRIVQSLPTSLPTTAPTDIPTTIPTSIPTTAPTNFPTLIPSTAVEIASVPTVMPSTAVANDQPERLLVGDDVVRHISSSNPNQNYAISPSAIDTLLLTVTSKQIDAKLTVELTNQQTGETVAFLRPAVTTVCIRISAGTDLYNLKINSDNKSVDSDYTLRLVTARQTQLDCPADPSQ